MDGLAETAATALRPVRPKAYTAPFLRGFTALVLSRLPHMLQKWLKDSTATAEEIGRSLRSFDGAPLVAEDFAPVLSHFQQLSQQVTQLGKRRADGKAILERHYVVPSSAEHAAAIPHLLSSRLEMELIAETSKKLRKAEATNVERAGGGKATWTEAALQQHNKTLKEAHDHLIRAAQRSGLPGLGGGDKQQQSSTSSNASGSSSRADPAAASGAAGLSDAERAVAASKLLDALRTGRGLEPSTADSNQ